MWIVAGIRFPGVLFSFLIAFVPPDQLPIGWSTFYVAVVLIGTIVFCGIPLIINQVRRPGWTRGVGLRSD
jgi:hypothetical protein